MPYIDRYVLELATDNEVLVLKGLNGELDWQEQWINAPRNKSVFFDNQDRGIANSPMPAWKHATASLSPRR